ncbi:MAG: hydantoinase B/oxoprolinase family protein [Thermoleophilaceae bacterium]
MAATPTKAHSPTETAPLGLDPVTMTVLANRFEAVVREMANTMLRAGRSAMLNTARDFSCSIVTASNELLASAEGLPVHVFGSHLLTEAMQELHPDLAPGDAFLHNDPYLGNSHHADQTVLVPIFVDGEHLFTACTKAHQADIGNALPTTYMATVRDVYEEGALSFPCIRVQRDYEDIGDIIRMCRRRIRVPDQWYGDYLAAVGSARLAEKRLQELVAKHGVDLIGTFVREWFDYSERRVVHAIGRLPAGRISGAGAHDPIPTVPDGVPIGVTIDIDPEQGMIDVDLRDNIDCVPAGLNQSAACAMNNAMTGVFNVLGEDLPHNAGSFRRLRVHLRENCVVGIPLHPTSCSMATTNVGDLLVNVTQSAFAELGEGWGLAEGGLSTGVPLAVISGVDRRRDGAAYVNQMMFGTNGGPASPRCDGWVTWFIPVVAGLMYRDSVEIDEQKYPIRIRSIRLVPDSEGPGRHRGAPCGEIIYGPREDPMTIVYTMTGHRTPPKGVRGGGAGSLAHAAKIDRDGKPSPLGNCVVEQVQPGEWVLGKDGGGGGYGDPLERDPAAVLADVLRGWVSRERARAVYGVVVTGDVRDESLAVDEAATAAERAGRQAAAEQAT